MVGNEVIKNIKTNLDRLLSDTSLLKQFLHVFTELLKIFFIKKQAFFNQEHIYDL